METKRKTNTVVTHERLENGILRFRVGEQSFDFDPAKAAHGDTARDHGYVQKISDRAAIGRDPETGASATPEEKFAAMKAVADRLMAGGPWNAVGTGTGSAGGLLYRVMQAIYPNTWDSREAFAEFIKGKAASESARLGTKVSESDIRAEYGEMKHIKKEMDKLRAVERKASGIDHKTLLEGLPS